MKIYKDTFNQKIVKENEKRSKTVNQLDKLKNVNKKLKTNKNQ